MSYKDDIIKVIEIIGSKSAPCDIIDGDQEVLVSEKDFKKISLSFESAYILIKDLFSKNVLSILEHRYSKKDGETLILKINDNFDIATISIKYPETVLSEQEEIIQELEAFPIKNPPRLLFDKEKSILTINDKKIKISLNSDKVNGHYVLEYLFENGIKKIADYVDILEKKFPNGKENNHSMYRACKDINAKIGKQASIGDFLEIHSGKTGWVAINPKFTNNLP